MLRIMPEKRISDMHFKKAMALAISVMMIIGITLALTACNNDKDNVPTVESISAKLAKDVSYSVGDTFDIEDVVVTCKMSDGTSKAVTTFAAIEYSFAGENVLDESGKFAAATTDTPYTLNLSFAGKTTTLSIAVRA